MKKQLLFTALLFSAATQAQQLELTNEPAIGATQTMYLLDTLTDAYPNITGSGVTWDYSNIVGMNMETRVIEILDATTTPFASSFPTSTKVMSIQGAISNYFTSNSSERSSQGFVYEEPAFGTVLATFDVDNETTIQYPFAFGDYFTDNFAGSLAFDFNGFPQTPAATGVAYASIDGQGTLLLPNSTSLSNVIRYKIVDTVFTQVNFIGVMDIEFVRTQYEYYDVANNSLPVFIHTVVSIAQSGGGAALMSQTNVVSSIAPNANLGIQDEAKNTFTVYPNPSEGMVTFEGDFAADATATIFDQTGRAIYTVASLTNGTTIDLSSLNKGIYLVGLTNNGVESTQTVVIK
jgi:hypothetical protein